MYNGLQRRALHIPGEWSATLTLGLTVIRPQPGEMTLHFQHVLYTSSTCSNFVGSVRRVECVFAPSR